MMDNPIRERVAALLEAMGEKPSSGVIRAKLEAAGLNKTYLYEFVSGKKAAINTRNIPAIAAILGCDPDYLMGGDTSLPASLRIEGICEAGAWRVQHLGMQSKVAIPKDSRYQGNRQHSFIVRGDHASPVGAVDGSVVIAVADLPARVGDKVVCQRSRDTGETELTIRVVTEMGYALPASAREVLKPEECEVVGVVTICLNTFI